MSDAKLRKPVDAYVGSIDNNLRHALGAQIIWVRRWKGELAVVDPEIAGGLHGASHTDLRALSTSDGRGLCGGAGEHGLTRQRHELPLGLLITHLVDHGTHHRGETGMLLERVGRSPGDMHYLYFEYEQTGQRR